MRATTSPCTPRQSCQTTSICSSHSVSDYSSARSSQNSKRSPAGKVVDWRWQDNGYEHHLRPSESLEGFGFYIFMNPYAAKLCALAAEWPSWVCPEPTEFAFLASLNDGQVPPEWLSRYQQFSSTLPVGE